MAQSSRYVTVDLKPLQRFAAGVQVGLRNHVGPIGKAFRQWGHRYRSFLRERFVEFSRGGGDWSPLKRSTILRRRVGKGTFGGVRTITTKAGVRRGENRGEKLQRMQRELVKLNESYTKKANKLAKSGAKRAKQLQQIAKLSDKIDSTRAEADRLPTMAGVAILRDTGVLLNAIDPTFKSQPGAVEKAIENGIRTGFGGPGRHPKGKATIADIAAFHQRGEGRLPVRKIIVDPPPQVVAQMAGDMQRAIAQVARGEGAE